MSKQEIDPIECQMMGMSVDKLMSHHVDLTDFKRKDAHDGFHAPSPASQVPEFVLRRASIVVSIDDTEVE
jgi:hypothetical protein